MPSNYMAINSETKRKRGKLAQGESRREGAGKGRSKQKTTDDGNLCFNNYKEGNSRDTTVNLSISRR